MILQEIEDITLKNERDITTLNSTIIPEIQSDLAKVSINVRKFRKDEDTDDTNAINDAIVYAVENNIKNIFFPDGVYRILSTDEKTHKAIILDNIDGLRLYGNGANTIIQGSNNGSVLYCCLFSLVNAKNITFESMTFDGNAQANFGENLEIREALNGLHAIYFNPPGDDRIDNVVINKCNFKNTYDSAIASYGLTAQDYPHPVTKRVKITNCNFSNIGAHGVGMNEFYMSIVSNCTFNNMGMKPVYANMIGGGMAVDVSGGCENIIVSNNVIDGTTAMGIKTQTHPGGNYAKNVLISNNIIKNIKKSVYIKGYGIKCDGINITIENNIIDGYPGKGIEIISNSIGCKIINNTILNPNGNDGSGISITGTIGSNLIANNYIDGSLTYGIEIASCNGVTVKGNQVSNSTFDGISCDSSQNAQITNNTCYNNKASGIKAINNSYGLIDGNQCYDTRTNTSRTQQRGIYMPIGNQNMEMVGNQFNNNVLKDYDVYSFATIKKIENGIKYAYQAAVPNTSKWNVGDIIQNTSPIAGGYGSICVTAGWACKVAWVASTSYLAGNYVYANDIVYKCTASGISSLIAPNHTTGSLMNGTATFEYVDFLAVFKAFGTIQG